MDETVTDRAPLGTWRFRPPSSGQPPDLERARMEDTPPPHPTADMPTALLRRNDPRRAAAEALALRVYAQQYGAAPQHFPGIMAARWNTEGQIVATCGLRFADEGFFSACYLDVPLHEAVGLVVGQTVPPDSILEVNTLASISRLHGTAIVADVILSAVRSNVLFGCFTAVARLAKILALQGLPLQRIADASIDRVVDHEKWGSYYENDPGVYVVDARPATTLAASSQSVTQERKNGHV